VTALGTRRDALARYRAPWSPRAWAQALYLAGGVPAQLFALFMVLILPWSLSAPAWGHLTGQHWTKKWAAFLLGLVVVFFVLPAFTAIHRHRLRATAGVVIPPPQPMMPNGLTFQAILTAARAGTTWRQVAYHLLAAPALAAAALVALGMWLAGILYALVYTYAWHLPAQGMLARGQSYSPTLPRLFIPVDVYLTVIGLALLAAAPYVTAAVASLDARAAQALLGPSRAEELEHRVERLTQTRAGVVDAADAERRRLERNLHDGTQQRLVSLAMNLGMARAQTETVEEAHQAITEAHEEAKAALAELRNLVRGLHPPVLEDRGLDAALSGVAARLPIPVRLTVNVPRRPAPTIEAVAYFVVSEGLTNITKHAQASQAEVFVQQAGDRLHIIVTDDGVGGADPARGSGLAGLARRAESVDGTLEIVSPHGGPTLLTVDLPCAR
jgi:signal transduction histidine kinase